MNKIGSTSAFSLANVVPAFESFSGATGTASDNMLDTLRKIDPAKADALGKQMQDSQSLLQQLDQLRKSMKQAPKAEAAQRVARIKAEIQMLQTMGGDPKVVARRVAQLARELGQAASQYASAGAGGDTGTESNAGSSANAAGSAGNASANAAAATQSNETATPATPETGSATDSATKTGTGTGTSTAADNYRQTQLNALQNKLNKNAARASESEADRRFINEVRSLAAKLKALACKAAEQIKEKGGTDDGSGSETASGLDAAARAVNQISSQGVTDAGQASVNVYA